MEIQKTLPESEGINMRIIFDQVITQLRQEHGLTQDELAE